MRGDELQAIESERRRQCEEKRHARIEIQAQIAEKAREEIAVQRAACVAARHVEILRRQHSKDNASILLRQMREKIRRDNERDQLYTNHVSSDFFAQFGTSHR